MKTLILTALLLSLSTNAFAIRCGTKIIQEGDTLYKVEKRCNIDYSYTVKGVLADIKKLYIKQGGMTTELTVIDGIVRNIKRGV